MERYQANEPGRDKMLSRHGFQYDLHIKPNFPDTGFKKEYGTALPKTSDTCNEKLHKTHKESEYNYSYNNSRQSSPPCIAGYTSSPPGLCSNLTSAESSAPTSFMYSQPAPRTGVVDFTFENELNLDSVDRKLKLHRDFNLPLSPKILAIHERVGLDLDQTDDGDHLPHISSGTITSLVKQPHVCNFGLVAEKASAKEKPSGTSDKHAREEMKRDHKGLSSSPSKPNCEESLSSSFEISSSGNKASTREGSSPELDTSEVEPISEVSNLSSDDDSSDLKRMPIPNGRRKDVRRLGNNSRGMTGYRGLNFTIRRFSSVPSGSKSGNGSMSSKPSREHNSGVRPKNDNKATQCRKRKRSSADDGNGEDEEDPPKENDESRSEQETKRLEEVRWNCPFYARNPESPPKKDSCFKSGFRDISTIKSHIREYHTPMIYCQRCKIELTKENEDKHSEAIGSANGCQFRSSNMTNFVTAEKTEQIRKMAHKDRGENMKEKRWNDMYMILFPMDPPEDIPCARWTKDMGHKLSTMRHEKHKKQKFELEINERFTEIMSNIGIRDDLRKLLTERLNEGAMDVFHIVSQLPNEATSVGAKGSPEEPQRVSENPVLEIGETSSEINPASQDSQLTTDDFPPLPIAIEDNCELYVSFDYLPNMEPMNFGISQSFSEHNTYAYNGLRF